MSIFFLLLLHVSNSFHSYSLLLFLTPETTNNCCLSLSLKMIFYGINCTILLRQCVLGKLRPIAGSGRANLKQPEGVGPPVAPPRPAPRHATAATYIISLTHVRAPMLQYTHVNKHTDRHTYIPSLKISPRKKESNLGGGAQKYPSFFQMGKIG